MEWLSTENVVAVGAAVLGIAVYALMVWYERRAPRHRRIGYRVQMDIPIGDDAEPRWAYRSLGLFEDLMLTDPTLVLLRIENDGPQGIDPDHYTGPELHGLVAVFTGRTICGVSVTTADDLMHHFTDDLMDHFTPGQGFGYEGNQLRIPRVPLNQGEHYKLLVLLSDGDVGSEIKLVGGIRNGRVHRNRSATPDDRPPLSIRAARLTTGLLTLCIVALASVIVGDGLPWLSVMGGTALVVGAGAVLLQLPRRSASHGATRAYRSAYLIERARKRREIIFLAAVSVLGYAVAVFSARPLLQEPHRIGFNVSETAQMIAAIGGLSSAVAAGAAAVIKAVAYLTYARADMMRARAGLPPAESGGAPEAETPSAAGE